MSLGFSSVPRVKSLSWIFSSSLILLGTGSKSYASNKPVTLPSCSLVFGKSGVGSAEAQAKTSGAIKALEGQIKQLSEQHRIFFEKILVPDMQDFGAESVESVSSATFQNKAALEIRLNHREDLRGPFYIQINPEQKKASIQRLGTTKVLTMNGHETEERQTQLVRQLFIGTLVNPFTTPKDPNLIRPLRLKEGQLDGIDAAREADANGDRLFLYVGTTSLGKTEVFLSELKRRLFKSHGLTSSGEQRNFFLVVNDGLHLTKQLESDIRAKLAGATFELKIWGGENKASSIVKITEEALKTTKPTVLVTTTASLRNAFFKKGDLDLNVDFMKKHLHTLFYDEAHHATAEMMKEFFELVIHPEDSKVKALGLTATSDSNLVDLFKGNAFYAYLDTVDSYLDHGPSKKSAQQMFHQLQISIDRGEMPPAHDVVIVTPEDLGVQDIFTRHPNANRFIVNPDHYDRLLDYLSPIYFQGGVYTTAGTIQELNTVTHFMEQKFPILKFGKTSSEVSEDKSSNQDNALELFRQGEIDNINAVRKLVEGINMPRARAFVKLSQSIDARSFLQNIGRVLRNYQGKDTVDIVLLLPYNEQMILQSLALLDEVQQEKLSGVVQRGNYQPTYVRGDLPFDPKKVHIYNRLPSDFANKIAQLERMKRKLISPLNEPAVVAPVVTPPASIEVLSQKFLMMASPEGKTEASPAELQAFPAERYKQVNVEKLNLDYKDPLTYKQVVSSIGVQEILLSGKAKSGRQINYIEANPMQQRVFSIGKDELYGQKLLQDKLLNIDQHDWSKPVELMNPEEVVRETRRTLRYFEKKYNLGSIEEFGVTYLKQLASIDELTLLKLFKNIDWLDELKENLDSIDRIQMQSSPNYQSLATHVKLSILQKMQASLGLSLNWKYFPGFEKFTFQEYVLHLSSTIFDLMLFPNAIHVSPRHYIIEKMQFRYALLTHDLFGGVSRDKLPHKLMALKNTNDKKNRVDLEYYDQVSGFVADSKSDMYENFVWEYYRSVQTVHILKESPEAVKIARLFIMIPMCGRALELFLMQDHQLSSFDLPGSKIWNYSHFDHEQELLQISAFRRTSPLLTSNFDENLIVDGGQKPRYGGSLTHAEYQSQQEYRLIDELFRPGNYKQSFSSIINTVSKVSGKLFRSLDKNPYSSFQSEEKEKQRQLFRDAFMDYHRFVMKLDVVAFKDLFQKNTSIQPNFYPDSKSLSDDENRYLHFLHLYQERMMDEVQQRKGNGYNGFFRDAKFIQKPKK